MKVKHEHIVAAAPKKVMEFFRDDDFYIKKLKNSGALSVEVVEHVDLPGGKLRRKAKVSEPSRIPAMIRKADVDVYADDSTLDPAAGVLEWKVTPNMMADKFFLSGKMEFLPEGKGTRLVFHTQLEVKIFGIGGMVEKVGLEKTEEEVGRQAAFIKQWVKDH
jgi:hypothetical protein